MQLKEYYKQNICRLDAELTGLKNRRHGFIVGEIVTFAAMIVFVVCHFAAVSSVPWWIMAIVAMAGYFVVRHYDVLNDSRIERLTALRHVSEKELMALDGNFSVFRSGTEYSDPQHEYSFDLDIFGSSSLFHRINRTITTGGSDALASLLANPEGSNKVATILERQEAVKEMAQKPEWRQEFMALGDKERIESKLILQVLENVRSMHISSFAALPTALVLAILLLTGFYAVVVACFMGVVSLQTVMYWAFGQFLLVFVLNSRSLGKVRKAVGDLHEQIKAFINIVELVSAEKFSASLNKKQHEALNGSNESIKQLDSLFLGMERRDTFVGIVLFNVFGLTDFFLVRRFLKWQNAYLGHMQQWIEAVGNIDALVSMGTMMFNNKETVFPEIIEQDKTEDQQVVYDTKALWHPFLGANAKKNDFSISNHSFYIVTGANMAGKSTFLRAVGVNYVLAMAGMPVFAEKMRCSIFKLFSSMRTQDDLTHGVSYFNAELLRLKLLIDFVDADNRSTLIILDEILKGTNSADKLSGSRMFLEAMSQKNVSGIIATHDLELSKMADEQPDRFHNYCFEIKMGEHVTYDYRITEGVARNQNATFLLQGILGKGI